MKVISFCRRGIELAPVEVEVSLMRGVSRIQIMGLPDSVIKESGLRLKSALKTQGFRWPRAQQIMVNLRPAHLKKTSQGLDLAIAYAYLWASGQITPPDTVEEVYVYGELGLDGTVTAPSDLALMNPRFQKKIISGPSPEENLPFSLLWCDRLSDLNDLQYQPKGRPGLLTKSPESLLPALRFSPDLARLLAVVAAGEHPVLFAGPSGSGKSTAAMALHHLMSPPTDQQCFEIHRVAKLFGKKAQGRPLVSPHHSATPMAMVGGGSPPSPGEFTRAHGGLLLMDEFLEFKPTIQEALREPVERGELVVSRGIYSYTFPADFLLVGTTNLCRCGDFVPGQPTDCSYSLLKCRSYLERLSGPLLDRFSLVGFSHTWTREQKTVTLKEVVQWVQKARNFSLETRGQERPNHRQDLEVLQKTVEPFVREHLLPEFSGSMRRQKCFFQVARTLADLDESELITEDHVRQSMDCTLEPFRRLRSF